MVDASPATPRACSRGLLQHCKEAGRAHRTAALSQSSQSRSTQGAATWMTWTASLPSCWSGPPCAPRWPRSRARQPLRSACCAAACRWAPRWCALRVRMQLTGTHLGFSGAPADSGTQRLCTLRSTCPQLARGKQRWAGRAGSSAEPSRAAGLFIGSSLSHRCHCDRHQAARTGGAPAAAASRPGSLLRPPPAGCAVALRQPARPALSGRPPPPAGGERAAAGGDMRGGRRGAALRRRARRAPAAGRRGGRRRAAPEPAARRGGHAGRGGGARRARGRPAGPRRAGRPARRAAGAPRQAAAAAPCRGRTARILRPALLPAAPSSPALRRSGAAHHVVLGVWCWEQSLDACVAPSRSRRPGSQRHPARSAACCLTPQTACRLGMLPYITA